MTAVGGTDQSARVAPRPVEGSLSPSRAADFKTCPLRFRLRSIDRLPEAPSAAAVRGTLVHAVLEELFDLPGSERTLTAAISLLPRAWARLRAEEPAAQALVSDQPDQLVDEKLDEPAWLASAEQLLANYFRLEDPTALEPAGREQYVEVVVNDVRLRGVLDRLDVAADGRWRIVDYKTGASPGLSGEGAALFQLKFYALLLWRTRGIVPARLQLIYLADTTTLSYTPQADELTRFEQTVLAIWQAIRRALPEGDFPPSPGRGCRWCSFTALCPAFGGTPPPYAAPLVLTDPRDPQ